MLDRIGAKLAAARKARGLTLQELSQRCGLSTSFLSQVERGVSAPSIVSLYRICRALEIPVSYVLPEPSSRTSPVRRREEQFSVELSHSSVSYRYLSGAFPERSLEALINEFPPGYRHPLVSHEGEEFGYVLEGELVLVVGEEEYPLRAGDAFHFPANRPHSYFTATGAKVLIVSTQRFFEAQSHIRRGQEGP